VRPLAVLAGLTAAAVLPGTALGVNVVIVAVLIGATVATTIRPSLRSAALGALSLALASMAAVLDAGWVVALDLAGAWLLATFAVAGHALAAPLAPLVQLRTLPSLAPSISPDSVRALRGVMLGGVLVVPFAALFWTADAAFAELGGGIPLPTGPSVPGRVLAFTAVLLAALGLALATRKILEPASLTIRRRLEPAEWAIALALLNLLFLAFVAVQLAVLFGGNDHVLRTAGLTYAEYARQGFWQLIVAAALTLAVVAGAALLAEIRKPLHALVLKGLLGSLCLLTIVIVASALHRLDLYSQAYGLTRPRLAPETLTLGLGALFALVLIAGALPAVRARLGPIVLYGAAAGLLAFSISNPDYRIAERNFDRWRVTGGLDARYARGLSADAAPALARLPSPLRERVLDPLEARLAEPEPWYAWNLSRARARDLQRPS
jgi:hypothetical protein